VWDQARPPTERRWQLFNLRDDGAEQHDLSAADPARYAQMLQGWERYARETGVVY
jgi:hypothetical protein